MLSATGGCEGGVLQPGQAEAAAQKPPEGPHWSPALAIRGSGAWERAGAAGARLPRSSHRHSPGRPAGPAPPAHAWPRRPGPPCPAEATAQPLPRPPSHQPRAGSSPASNCPGSSSEESSDRSRAGCLRPAPPPARRPSLRSGVCQHPGLGPPSPSQCPRAGGQPEGLSLALIAPWCAVSVGVGGRGDPAPEAQGALRLACLQVHGRGFGAGNLVFVFLMFCATVVLVWHYCN